MLGSLYQIREALINDIKSMGVVTGNSAQSNEKDAKIAELEAENKRLNYRILHLSENLKKELEKNQ